MGAELAVAAGKPDVRLMLKNSDPGQVVQVGTLLEDLPGVLAAVLAAAAAAAASVTAAVDAATVAAGKAGVVRLKNGRNPVEVVRVEAVLENPPAVLAVVPAASSAPAVAAWIVGVADAGQNNSPKDPALLVLVRALLESPSGRDHENPERFL